MFKLDTRGTKISDKWKIVNGEFRCNFPKCEKKFVTKGTVVDHYRVHSGEKPYVCWICSKRFKWRSSMAFHKKVHKKEKGKKTVNAKKRGKKLLFRKELAKEICHAPNYTEHDKRLHSNGESTGPVVPLQSILQAGKPVEQESLLPLCELDTVDSGQQPVLEQHETANHCLLSPAVPLSLFRPTTNTEIENDLILPHQEQRDQPLDHGLLVTEKVPVYNTSNVCSSICRERISVWAAKDPDELYLLLTIDPFDQTLNPPSPEHEVAIQFLEWPPVEKK